VDKKKSDKAAPFTGQLDFFPAGTQKASFTTVVQTGYEAQISFFKMENG